jgi:hypothetical protein
MVLPTVFSHASNSWLGRGAWHLCLDFAIFGFGVCWLRAMMWGKWQMYGWPAYIHVHAGLDCSP